jgi:hypothetical protein
MMLESITSAPAPTGVRPLSLSGDVQQLAGHCAATIANGQPLHSLLVDYGQASCFASCMLPVAASICLATAAVRRCYRLASSHGLGL